MPISHARTRGEEKRGWRGRERGTGVVREGERRSMREKERERRGRGRGDLSEQAIFVATQDAFEREIVGGVVGAEDALPEVR
jgi:hypothetical protein